MEQKLDELTPIERYSFHIPVEKRMPLMSIVKLCAIITVVVSLINTVLFLLLILNKE